MPMKEVLINMFYEHTLILVILVTGPIYWIPLIIYDLIKKNKFRPFYRLFYPLILIIELFS